MSSIENRIRELGHKLPNPPSVAGSYVPWVRVGDLLYLSGTLASCEGVLTHVGKIGVQHDIASGQEAARLCALNSLAVIKEAVGSLDLINRIVFVGGFVNAQPGFVDSPAVINGASDLLVEILGEAGKHARAAVAVTGLPKDSTVELQVNVLLKK